MGGRDGVESVWVVVLAGGRGSRFGGEVPKQFLELRGEPVLLHSLRSLLSLSAVAGAVVPVAADEGPRLEAEVLSRVELLKPVKVVPGGATRAASVRRGIEAVPSPAAWVMVHDGARPNLSRELLDRLLGARSRGRAAIPGLPVTDTLKRVADGRVEATVDRAPLMSVQTPQLFALDLLRRAHASGDAGATDDAALVEALGEEVLVVEGDPENIKVTRPADLAVLEVLMGRGEGGA